jgi:hypothetical protein
VVQVVLDGNGARSKHPSRQRKFMCGYTRLTAVICGELRWCCMQQPHFSNVAGGFSYMDPAHMQGLLDCRVARFHADHGWLELGQEPITRRPSQRLAPQHLVPAIHSHQVEEGLCQVDADSRRLRCRTILCFSLTDDRPSHQPTIMRVREKSERGPYHFERSRGIYAKRFSA